MTLLVFGGTGFVGSSIIKRCKYKEKIISFSSKKVEIISSNKKKKINYTLSIDYINKQKKIDAIFCAATRYDPKKYRAKPEIVFNNNIKSILKFIKTIDAAYKKVSKILIISSYAVYGDTLKDNSENSILSTENFSKREFNYAFAKYIQEKLIINFCKEKNIKYNIIRLPSIYGPGSTLNKKNAHVVPSFILQILKNRKNMNVYGTGNEKREFIYIYDLIKIIIKLRKVNYSDIINVGSNKLISIKNLLKNIISLTNSSILAKFNNESFSDVPIRKVNYRKFNTLFKGFRFTNISSGLNETIKWYKEKL